MEGRIFWPKGDTHDHFPLAGIAATTIALGRSHTCVIVAGGGVKCWGLNDDGQLGIGNTVQQNSPANVPLGAGNMRRIYPPVYLFDSGISGTVFLFLANEWLCSAAGLFSTTALPVPWQSRR